jgi:hypothetical protein
MFPFFRQHMRLLSVWMFMASALLLANPWGRFGWIEQVALVGPLILGLDRRVHREFAFALGLPLIALLCVLDSSVAILPRLFVAWSVFAVGVLLMARMIDGHRDLEEIAGHVAFGPADTHTLADFRMALDREFGRARRHDGTFVLLSVSAHPRSIELGDSTAYSGNLLRELAENRARLELHGLLAHELHVYSDVVAAGDRVLALVPEVEAEAVEPLIERVQHAIGNELDLEVQIGVGCFPRDAVSADELIAAADRNRTNSRLRRLPDHIDEPEDLAREVQS